MQRHLKTILGTNSMARRFGLAGIGLALTATLAWAATSNTFAHVRSDAEETYLTVAWYLKGGYWREDVQAYLTHAEYLFCPTSGIESRLEFSEDE